MNGQNQIPWPQIHEYLLEVEAATTMAEFRLYSMKALEHVLPCDAGLTFCDVYGTGGCVATFGFHDRFAFKYNTHYGPRAPYDWRKVSLDFGVADFRNYRGTEFVDDFIKPEGVGYKVGRFFPGAKIALGVLYSWSPRIFTHEIDTMGIVNQHLDLIFRRIERAESRGTPTQWCADLVPVEFADFWKLTKRESEILNFLLCGYNAQQIALRLFVATRTVETHVAHLYSKTGVRNRRELAALIESTPDTLE